MDNLAQTPSRIVSTRCTDRRTGTLTRRPRTASRSPEATSRRAAAVRPGPAMNVSSFGTAEESDRCHASVNYLDKQGIRAHSYGRVNKESSWRRAI